jgi:hypothetical protein
MSNFPDSGIKKAKVLKEDLPAFNSNDLGYFVRYRIVSSDKNRSSHWSPYYFLQTGAIQPVPCSVTVSGTSPKVLNLVWQHPKIAEDSAETEISIFKQYDIYIRTNLSFNPDDLNPLNGFYYLSSPSSTQFSTLLPTGISWFQVAVQVPTYPKTYSTDAAIFTSAQTSV